MMGRLPQNYDNIYFYSLCTAGQVPFTFPYLENYDNIYNQLFD